MASFAEGAGPAPSPSSWTQVCDDGRGQQIQICVMPFADRIMVILCHFSVGRPGTWVECVYRPRSTSKSERESCGGGRGCDGAVAEETRERPRFSYKVMLGRREDPMVNLLSEKVAIAVNGACAAREARVKGKSNGAARAKVLKPVVIGIGLEGGKVDANVIRKVEHALLAHG